MKNKKCIFGKKALSWMLALALAVSPAAGFVGPVMTVEAAKSINTMAYNGPDTIMKDTEKELYTINLPLINGESHTQNTYVSGDNGYADSLSIFVKQDGEWVEIDEVLSRVADSTVVDSMEDGVYSLDYWVNEAQNWSGWVMNLKISGTVNYIRLQSNTDTGIYCDYKLQEVGAIQSAKFVNAEGKDSITIGSGQSIAVNYDYLQLNDGNGTIGAKSYGADNFTWEVITASGTYTAHESFTTGGITGGYDYDRGFWFSPTESMTIRATMKSNTSITADYEVIVEVGEKGNEKDPSASDTANDTPASDVNKAGYKLVWSDEFDGSGNPDISTGLDLDKWSFQLGDGTVAAGLTGWGNGERQSYTNRVENIGVNENGNGLLRITAQYEEDGYKYSTENTSYYTSARIVTKGTEETGPLFNTTYGYVEARMALPATKGAWPAFWMLPQSTDIYGAWPVSGEIDIMETTGINVDSACATLHYGAPDHVYLGSGYEELGSGIEYWHTYAVDWQPGKITFLYDGQEIYTQTNWESKIPGASESLAFDAPFNQPYYILLNLAVDSGTFGGSGNTATFQDEINMYVDYVRVYHKDGGYDATNVRRTQSNGKSDWASLAAEGNQVAEITADSVVTAEDGNVNALETDGTVDAGKWYLAYGAGGASTVTTTEADGQTWAKVDVTAAGTESYGTQLIGHYDAKKGYVYKISLDAYAEGEMVGKTVSFDSKEWKGWATYGISSFTLEDNPTSYSFLIDQQADFENCRMEVNLGAVGTGTVYVGNVKVEVVDPATLGDDKARSSKPLASGEVLYNGTFDQGFNKVGYWTALEGTNFSVPAYTTVQLADDDVSVVDVAAKETRYYESRAKISGATPAIYQSGFALAEGEYTLAFDLYTEAATDVTAALYSVNKAEDGTETLGNKLIESKTITTTSTPEVLPYSWTFEAPRALTNAALVLTFGDNASVQLDNVTLMPSESATVSGAESMDQTSSSYIKITYEMNDSAAKPAVNSDANPFYYKKGEGTITLSEPTREGYSFAGWSLNGTAEYAEDYVTEVSTNVNSITLWANWGEKITDTQSIPVTGVTVEDATVAVGSTVTLEADVIPSNATNQKVTWNSENQNVATVDALTGVVTGQSAGTAQITVTTADGNFTDTCTVTVTESTIPVTSVSIPAQLDLQIGDTQKLIATIAPEDATNQNVIWESAKPQIADVDAEGNVTAYAEGTAVITVKTEDGAKTATCIVIVAAKTDASVPQIITGNNVQITEGEEAAKVEVNAITTDNGTLTYQWYESTTASTEDGIAIEGATASTYTPDDLTVGKYYFFCVVTNTNVEVSGETTANAVSAVITYEVTPAEVVNAKAPQITAQPTGAQYKAGATANALVVTAASQDSGQLSYQWYKNTANATTGGTKIENATQASYTPSTATVGTVYYYCVVTNTKDVNGTKTATATSMTAAITVTGENVSTPRILTQPQGVNAVYGQAAGALSVQVLPVTDGTLSYQWYASNTAAANGTAIAGATGTSYTPSTGAAGTSYYYCVVTNTNTKATGAKKATATSNVVAVNVAKTAGAVNVASEINKTYGNKAFNLNAVGNGTLAYASSNSKIVEVDAAGNVKIKNTGIATITITASGDANHNAASAQVTIKVAPKKVTGLKVKSNAKGKITVNWKKNNKATGYEIQYSTSSKFKGAKTVTISKNKAKKPSTTISKKLKAGKKYYVRIRAYKNKAKAQRVYSAWSAKKKVTVKK